MKYDMIMDYLFMIIYLVIDDIKGYFNIDYNVGSILNLILTDDQKNKYI